MRRVIMCADEVYPLTTRPAALRKQSVEEIQARYDAAGFETRYYNPEVHVASFALPNYIKVLMK